MKDDFHFWSESWDKKIDCIFEIQDEVSNNVAVKKREQIGYFNIDNGWPRKKSSLSAYELYL